MVIPATEQYVFIIGAVLNILHKILDMVATVSTLSFRDTRGFPSCSFVMRIVSSFLVDPWVHEYMLGHYNIVT